MADVSVLRSGATLAIIAAVCTTLVAATYHLTRERIATNEQAWLEQSLQPVLSGVVFDSGISESLLTIPAPHELPGSEAAAVYRVYAGDMPVAALFVVSARDGYAGAIRLLVGVDIRGVVTGVHVLAHRETPGLGDGIETGKSNWASQFRNRSLQNPAAGGWKLRQDGGDFDQLTGASITPRAVIKAVKETLQYFDANATAIFAASADPVRETKK